MIGVAHKFAVWLMQQGAIDDEDLELYEYAGYCILLTVLPLTLAFCIGLCFGMAVESVLMLLPFIVTRKFSGGYHLRSATVCMIVSVILITLFSLGVRFLIPYIGYDILTLLVCMAFILICVLSPIDSEERQLSDKEKCAFKKIAIIASACFLFLYGILIWTKSFQFASPIGMGILLTCILQLPCIPHIIKAKLKRRTTV